MDLLTGAFHVAATVIVVGGIAKVASPDAFSSLLRSLSLPAGRMLARAVGAVEVVIGSTAIVVGGRGAAAAVAVAYAAFSAAVVLARRSGASTCGCFGAAASPPSRVHIVVNATSAAVALATALVGELPPLQSVLGDQPVAAVPYVVTVATGAWLAVALDTVGATVFERMAAVSEMGPTFRASSGHDHPHTHTPTRSGAARP